MVEAYNPNPTILKPTSSSVRREQRALSSLWDIDDSQQDSDDDNDSEEVEEIDQDEVFGAVFVFLADSNKRKVLSDNNSQISFAI
jgi:hypothetical protein